MYYLEAGGIKSCIMTEEAVWLDARTYLTPSEIKKTEKSKPCGLINSVSSLVMLEFIDGCNLELWWMGKEEEGHYCHIPFMRVKIDDGGFLATTSSVENKLQNKWKNSTLNLSYTLMKCDWFFKGKYGTLKIVCFVFSPGCSRWFSTEYIYNFFFLSKNPLLWY